MSLVYSDKYCRGRAHAAARSLSRPLKSFCPFASVHANWAVKMVDRLNEERLSDRFLAQSSEAPQR